MRLIDADEVLGFPNLPTSGYEDTMQDLIAENIPEDAQIEYEKELEELCKSVVSAVMNVVKTSHTVDAEPVVHAHWEVTNSVKVSDNPYPFYAYHCSRCGRTESSPCQIEEFIKNTPYCHCGAKMDEEE